MPDRLTAPNHAGARTLVIATGHDLSLALGEGGAVLAQSHRAIGIGHAEALMPAIIAVLAPFGGSAAGVRHIIVEVGPGSFTGLRIGHAAAAALALAWGATLAGVRSTLLVAAAEVEGGTAGRLAVALAAPRGQIWWERFYLPDLVSLSPPQALDPATAHALMAQEPWAGTAGQGARPPNAAAALRLPPHLLDPAIPLYVRPQDATAVA